MSEKLKRIYVLYAGRVQGVGFRFTAERIAVDLGIGGWVKNLPDGRVEMTCEGKEKDLLKILARIDKVFSKYIREKNVQWSEAIEGFTDFEIRFF